MRSEVRAGERERALWRATQSACTGRDHRLKAEGARARAERTLNMANMSVTLDVSKLSAWLNAFANCRVEKRACDARRGIHGPRGVEALGGGDASGVHGKRLTQGCGGQGTRGAHGEHVVHGRDLGRVEAERLVERVRLLPSRKAGMRCGKRCGPGGMRALGGGDASGMCTGRARLKAVGGAGHARSARGTCRSCS